MESKIKYRNSKMVNNISSSNTMMKMVILTIMTLSSKMITKTIITRMDNNMIKANTMTNGQTMISSKINTITTTRITNNTTSSNMIKISNINNNDAEYLKDQKSTKKYFS